MVRSTSRKIPVVLATVAYIFWIAAGCAKKPSPAYEEAADRFNQLYREKWDDAYLDPQMADIEAKLESVPTNNISSELAQALLKRIRENRTRLQEDRERLDKGVDAALEPVKVGALPPPSPRTEASADEETPVPAQDAAIVPTLRQGLSVRDLEKYYRGCFSQSDDISVLGKGMLRTYAIRDLNSCKDKYPSLINSLLVIDAEKIYAIVDRAKLEYRYEDGGVPSRRDASE